MATRTIYAGPSIWTIVGIVFIILKLVDAISWSWWWVLAPFWIPWLIFLTLGVLIAFVWASWRVTLGRQNRINING